MTIENAAEEVWELLEDVLIISGHVENTRKRYARDLARIFERHGADVEMGAVELFNASGLKCSCEDPNDCPH